METVNFVAIPGFSKYETNGKTVRNATTKKALNLSSGRNSFQMLDDNGSNRSVTLATIKEKAAKNLEKASKKPEVQGNPRARKDGSKKAVILALHRDGKTIDQIVEKTGYQKGTVNEAVYKHTVLSLFDKGLSAEKISEKTGYKLRGIITHIEKYRSGDRASA